MGLGPKQDFGNVRATESQALQAGQKARDILGPEGQQTLERFGQIETQARELEAKIADPATPPADRMMAQKDLQDIQAQREQLVKGAQPTVGQLVPNEKTVAYEADMRTLDNAPFAARDKANNAGDRRDSGRWLQDGRAGGGEVSWFKIAQRHRSGRSGCGCSRADDGRAGGRGVGRARDAGRDWRGRADAAGRTEQGGEGAGKRTVAGDRSGWEVGVAARLGSGDGPRLVERYEPKSLAMSSSARKARFCRCRPLPPVVPFRDAQRLRSNIGFAERALRAAPGNDQSLRRLGMLKTALDNAIADGAEAAARGDGGLTDRLMGVIGKAPDGSVAGGERGGGVAASGLAGSGGPGAVSGSGKSTPKAARTSKWSKRWRPGVSSVKSTSRHSPRLDNREWRRQGRSGEFKSQDLDKIHQ